jgi:hypothetical protein
MPGRFRRQSVAQAGTLGPDRSVLLPKRNYGYEKRQKELTRQNKREEKRQRKLERAVEPAVESEGDQPESPAPPHGE